ncbi:hypothetical protein Pcinc_000114 [Petrolisthes cinctipes]|uniref:Uncharacterized protein n=1 Tax=Petrolisthes cinctipes TaxID=88211 RepID=A0AAE1GPY2_PETCI|nr:hypothetical protein Pcinc_000114 [Petrolisthes cinctipes]
MYYFDLAAVPLAFQGYGEYLVEQFGDMWVWYNSITNTTMATLSAQALNYPIGRLSWNIKEKVCEQESGQRVLTLSPCQVGEFTCTDGSCIPFAKRCDLKFDCKDKTDESFCDIVNFPGDYRSKLPPRPALNKGDDSPMDELIKKADNLINAAKASCIPDAACSASTAVHPDTNPVKFNFH